MAVWVKNLELKFYRFTNFLLNLALEKPQYLFFYSCWIHARAGGLYLLKLEIVSIRK